ncbi:MAG: hypothetical protein ISS26_00120 [Candidatus Omnitrophica bacterium]|nr:hypothetical protein [Candidatus Omnitrophota bacterium]
MRKIGLQIFITLIFLLSVVSARVYCDEINLKNGNSIKGIIIKESEGSLTLEIGIGSITVLKEDMESINRTTEEENDLLRSEWTRNKADRQKEYQRMKENASEANAQEIDLEALDGSRKDNVAKKESEKASSEKPWYDFTSPESTFNSHMYACKALDFEKSDLCYTKEFQSFTKTNKEYRSHRNTGQLRNAYDYWHNKPYKLEMHRNKAIMRFSPPFKRPEPFYFVKEADGWKIDGMFSFNNLIIENSGGWFWRNSKIDNEKVWLSK